MVLGLSLSLLGLLGLAVSAKKVSESTDAASVLTDAPSGDVWSNSADFAEKYMSDTVVDSSSPEPFISSNEMVRPSLGGGDKDDRKLGKHPFLGGFGSGVLFTLSTSKSSLWYLVCLGLGAYVAYKVVN